MNAGTVPGKISAHYQYLQPAVAKSDGNIDKATEVNARFQAELLRSSSTVIPDAAKANQLKITAGVYDLATGKVRLSEPLTLE
jgi:carbonic anhydrase